MSILRFLALGVLLAAAGHVHAAELRVKVTELRSDDGDVHFALYATPDSFPKKKNRYAGAVVKAKDGGAEAVFRNLAPGSYAVAVYHDENGNDEFDQGVFGIPLEGYAFSNGAKAVFGAPGFDEAAVIVRPSVTEITIRMHYPAFARARMPKAGLALTEIPQMAPPGYPQR